MNPSSAMSNPTTPVTVNTDPLAPIPEEPPGGHRDERAAALAEFDPLPIPHASWFLRHGLLGNEDLLTEYVRITGVATLSLLWSDDAAYATCERAIKRAGRGIIALLFSPYERLASDTAASFDLAWAKEVLDVAQHLEHVMSLPQAPLIKRAILDHEQYIHAKEPLVGLKLDAMYRLFHEHGLPVTWFGQGMMRWNVAHPDGWELWPWTLPSVSHDRLFGLTLYELADLTHTRDLIRHAAGKADEHDAKIAAWVCLGTGYTHDWDIGRKRVWRKDVTYRRANTWRFAFELGHPRFSRRPNIYAPYDRIAMVVFYPTPYELSNPVFHEHFLAYLSGWNNRRMDEDITETESVNDAATD